MVRYPEENPLPPSKPQAQTVSPKMDQQVVLPKLDQAVKNEEVVKLQQRVHSLEEKLSSLERHKKVNNYQKKNPVLLFKDLIKSWDRYRIMIIFALCLGTLLCALFFVKQHLYMASLALELRPKMFDGPGEKDMFQNGDLNRLLGPPSLLGELTSAYVVQMDPRLGGKIVYVRITSFGLERTEKIALDWQKVFVQMYVYYRKCFLWDRLKLLDKSSIETQGRLEKVLRDMEDYRVNEQYFLVNQQTKEKLIRLARNNAIELEKEFMGIHGQLAGRTRKMFLLHWSPADKALLQAYRLKLADMEFKRFLVEGDFLAVYDEGMRNVKSASAQLINNQAKRENTDDVTTSLIIKDFFLSNRQQAIEAVLSKRYVVSINELSSRSAAYLDLKEKFEALDAKLRNIASMEKAIKTDLLPNLSREVVVQSPLHLGK